jgi:acid phosphatase
MPKFVAVVTRHGARAPNKLFEFEKAWWQPHEIGELTPGGIRQMYLLGREFRKRYIEDIQFLSPEYDMREFHVYSSDVRRAIESA